MLESLHRLRELHHELGIPADYGDRRGLPMHEEAADVVLGDVDPLGNDILLSRLGRERWLAMKAEARRDGIVLVIESGFRSIEFQADLIRKAISEGMTITDALTWIAAPGYSEHHTGRAIDIGSPDCFPTTTDFERTAAFAWLSLRAEEFGFSLSYPSGNPFGIIFEPWHWFLASE